MLQRFFETAPPSVSTLISSAAPILLVVIAASAVLSTTTRKPAREIGTHPPRRLKGRLPILEDLVTMIGAARCMHEWALRSFEEGDFTPFLIRSAGVPDKTALCSPETYEDVFKTHFDVFPKGEFMTGILGDLLGNGIFAVDGEQWAAQRKTASRLFTMRALRESMTSAIRKHSVVLREIFERAAQSGERLDLFNLFNRFTIEAFAEIGFGVSLGILDSERDHPFQRAFDSAQKCVVMRFLLPAWIWKTQRWLGIGAEGQLRRDLDVINSIVLGMIDQSAAQRQQIRAISDTAAATSGMSDDKQDIVSLFLDNYSAITGKGTIADFDPTLLRDIVVNFLVAGRDTTAQALSWFFYCLDRNPRVADKIREELRAKIPDMFEREDGDPPTMEQVSRLVYLDAALRETLRLYPSVPESIKGVTRDLVLSDGTPIQAGTAVFLSFYAMGRNPHVWGHDATEFKPERWIEYVGDHGEMKIKNVSAFKFIAFNAGPRTCLGMNLAMLEMKIVVASLLSRFRVALTAPEDVTYDLSLTLPMKNGLWARAARLGAT